MRHRPKVHSLLSSVPRKRLHVKRLTSKEVGRGPFCSGLFGLALHALDQVAHCLAVVVVDVLKHVVELAFRWHSIEHGIRRWRS